MPPITSTALAQGGVPLWTNRYEGPGNSNDKPFAVAVDGNGNVFVTGHSASTNQVPYNYDYATIKYSGDGVPLSTNRYNGPGNGDDRANALAVDSAGNVLVTGTSSDDSSDFATIKYSSSGVPLWTNRYDGPANSLDVAHAVALDSNGNVFVTGYSDGDNYFDFTTIKYSSAGEAQWTNRYDGPGNGDDWPTALAVDSTGNVFVTGMSHGGDNTYNDYATIAYSSTGVALWTNRHNGLGNYHDSPTAVAVDGSGNVFVTGYDEGPGGRDYATIKYSSAGVSLWTNRYNETGIGDDFATAIAVDGSDKVFVTGYSWTLIGYENATVAYSSTGAPLWTNRFKGVASSTSGNAAVAVDSNGNVFVTGYSWNGSSHDNVTAAYSSTGVPLWTNRFNGLGNDYLHCAIAVDRSGNVFVTGESYATGGLNPDYVTIKYSSSIPPAVRLELDRDGSGGYFIRFTGGPGFTYRLQRANDLAGSWINLATNTAPPSGLVEFHDTSPLAGQAFYRTAQP